MHYNFEWNNQKTQTDLRKHIEVSFERAATVFIDPKYNISCLLKN